MSQSYYRQNRKKCLAYAAAYYRKNRKKRKEYAVAYRRSNRAKLTRYEVERCHKDKLLVLTRYGKRRKLCCRWHDCGIRDLDMLTLDHINNNGARHREQIGMGSKMYRWIIKHNFPTGFQTLCGGHQWKKEILRRKQSKRAAR